MTTDQERAALKARVMRNLGLPEDGGMTAEAATGEEPLRSFNGTIIDDGPVWLVISFASLADAAGWAECITRTAGARQRVEFVTAPASLYGPATVCVRKTAEAAGGGPDGDTYEAALRRAKGNTAHCDDAALMAGFLAAAAHTLLGAVSPMQIWQGAQAKGLTTAQLTELIHRNPAEAADLMWAES